jgi:peptide/nickel transport system substrate-binding protein
VPAAERPSRANGGVVSRDAPDKQRPVGTAPYRFLDFEPGDSLRAELNATYRAPRPPHFETLELKGGDNARSAARAVLQTGGHDFAGIQAGQLPSWRR